MLKKLMPSWSLDLIRDTLKKKEASGEYKWSRTSLTMFTAWIVVLWSYHYDLVKNGFNFEAFLVLTTVALGSKLTDALSKRWGGTSETKS